MHLSEQRQRDLAAFTVGLIAEGAMFAILAIGGENANPAAILFYVEALLLGWVFGARAGMIGAAGPFAAISLLDIAFLEHDQRGELLVLVLFVVVTLAFTAGMVGALRERYVRPLGQRPAARRRPSR